VVTSVIIPLVLAVVAVVRKHKLAHAVGGDIAWLCTIVGLVVAGLVLFGKGIYDRVFGRTDFKPGRGRESTHAMLLGGGLLVLAIFGIIML
jgi:hypothetical protein